VPIESAWWQARFHGWQSVAAHACAFAIFGMLLRWGTGRRGSWWLAAAVTSISGALDEWHQSFTPDRDVELSDWIVDTLAGTAGSILVSATMLSGLASAATFSRPRVNLQPGLSLRVALVAATAMALVLTFTPAGHPVRAVARGVVHEAVPTRVQVYAADLSATTHQVASRVKNKVGRLLSG
jgi:hypothetical protein